MSPIPDRVLVVGLARSGRAAIAALQRAGKEVVAYDRDETVALDDLDVTDLVLGDWDAASLRGSGSSSRALGCPKRPRRSWRHARPACR